MSAYTVEIQTSTAEGTPPTRGFVSAEPLLGPLDLTRLDLGGTGWQAVRPAENIPSLGRASDVVISVVDAIRGRRWRIAVWDGPDADTSTDPDYTLTDEEYRYAVIDALTRAE